MQRSYKQAVNLAKLIASTRRGGHPHRRREDGHQQRWRCAEG